MDEVYHDIQPWHFKGFVNVFGAKEGESRTSQVKTKERTKKLFDDKEFNSATDLQFVELCMQKQHTPRALMLIAVTSARINAKQ
jgi:pyruvate decarboxylase